MFNNGRINYEKTFVPVSPDKRNIIINNINTIEDFEVSNTGRSTKKWWKGGKHDPENEIPKNIYLLGSGTFDELYNKYVSKYGNQLSKKEFKDYTRELIKQEIMI